MKRHGRCGSAPMVFPGSIWVRRCWGMCGGQRRNEAGRVRSRWLYRGLYSVVRSSNPLLLARGGFDFFFLVAVQKVGGEERRVVIGDQLSVFKVI